MNNLFFFVDELFLFSLFDDNIHKRASRDSNRFKFVSPDLCIVARQQNVSLLITIDTLIHTKKVKLNFGSL